MNTVLAKKLRLWIFLLISVALYFLIHEGVHVIVANYFGIFSGARFNLIGIEILVSGVSNLPKFYLALFSGLAPIVTISIGYFLFYLMPRFLVMDNKFLKGLLYYLTVVFLVLDPIYIGFLSFIVGGDVNGISYGLNISEIYICIIFMSLAIFNLVLVFKKVIPAYTKAFLFEI